MTNFDDLFAPYPQSSKVGREPKPSESSPEPHPSSWSFSNPAMATSTSELTGEHSSSPQDPSPVHPPRRGGIVDQIVNGVVDHLRPLLEQRLVGDAPVEDPTSAQAEQVNQLQAQLDLMQLRQEKLHRQVVNYEAEIDQLNKEKRLLEQTVAELPEIYQLKFQARLEPIRRRIQQIQAENQHLRAEVYELSHHLHQGTPLGTRHWSLRLPQFSRPAPQPLTALPRPTNLKLPQAE